MELSMKNVLFLCSQNRLRSPTAETVFSEADGYDVRSAGLNNDAIEPTTPEIIEWADYIFVMEKTHRNKLQKKFRKQLNGQRVICLDIPDEYEYMEEALVSLLKSKLGPFFARKR
jgi:predicted protein tyrosine phosphatase